MITCSHCGQEARGPETWMDCRVKEIMIEKSCCFNCGFWFEKIEIHDDKTFIIDGTRWHDGGGIYKGKGFMGMGGREFFIKKKDGKLAYTNNLWCQGNVPEHFKKYKELKNNATFITEKQYVNLSNKHERENNLQRTEENL